MNVYEAATIIRRRLCNIRVLKEPRFQLTLCDEGCGISNLDNVFVPFYSTKSTALVSGLCYADKLSKRMTAACPSRIKPTRRAVACALNCPCVVSDYITPRTCCLTLLK